MKKITVFLMSACLALPAVAGLIPSVETMKAEEGLIVGTEGSYDVVVYGATSAGVTAAIAAKREGADVLLISQTSHLGGLTSSGLGATDMANKNVVGGISWEFYNRVYEYYKNDSAWVSETRDDYFGIGIDGAIYGGKNDALEMQWVFEPKVALQIFEDMLIEEEVPVIFNEPIDLDGGVNKTGGRITEIVSENGKRFEAKVFIDCSYEGDLMAEAGVTYTVGRESNSEYGETMNGILPNQNEYENVSPYIVEGDPDSGLLPFIEDSALGMTGDADSRVQAYCFRFTLTTDPENRLPITKPENYHPEWYETRARVLQANPNAGCELTQNRMPNNKTDTNHADFVGMSYEYANGDYLSRKNIEDDHRDYALGLLYFYAYDERVPLSIREEVQQYGLAKDEFTDNGNFPVQIYLREGRRMVSDYVMKESDVIQSSVPGVIMKTTAPHSVGQGFYWFDSHRVAYFKAISSIGDGYQTDGNFWSSRRDYPIAYESIRPKKSECENLYVPVCLSSTHAAYGSIRMETTYMILGESAGTAAAMSAEEMKTDPDFCVQDLNYARLAAQLSLNGQLLGDVVADDLSAGDLAVLKLTIQGLVDDETSELLCMAISEGINTAERVGAVKQTFIAAARRIVADAEESDTLAVLNKFGIISNSAAWESLFGETLPASLSVDNTVAIFNKITTFFANESPLGYITDWVKYFHENGIISEELRNHFDDNAVSGRTCNGAMTQKIFIAIAKTIDPSVTNGDEALQVFINTKMTGNASVWESVFRGESESVSGSNVNGLLKNAYSYLYEHEAEWKDVRLGVAYADYLLEKGILLDAEYSELLKGTATTASINAELLKEVIVNTAKYFNTSADETTAIGVLSSLDIDTTNISQAMNGTAVAGTYAKDFLLSVVEKIETTPRVEALSADITGYLRSLGIMTETEVTTYTANAVSGGEMEIATLNKTLSKISARITVAGETSIEKLFAVGILDEETKTVLSSTAEKMDGALANTVIRNVYAYLMENNTQLTADYLQLLQKENILTAEDIEKVKVSVSQFGFAETVLIEKMFVGMAKRIDATVTDTTSALALLQDINAIQNTETWMTLLEGETVSGLDSMSVVNTVCKFISTTLADYEYLVEKEYITLETATYFVRHGNNSNRAMGTQIVALLVSVAKPMDGTVADGTAAVATLKSNGVINNDAGWLNIVENSENEVTVANLVNLIEKAVDKIQQIEIANGDVEELSDEVLSWFVEKGYIKEGTYGPEYFKENAKLGGGTLNQGETQNMLIRAFRGVTGTGGTGTTLTKAITQTDFTFSDDPTENETLRTYWYARIETKNNPVDGEMLRVLMLRIYDYMNEVSV